ncbi:hypothetical protein KD146_17465 [Devosia sp. BSSL-BM10]|uniref:Uncharacterized protein n=1 Tax=Devosia litorisediminis TaxID=2829817 RepID=A0A942I6M0_9HYPH|nr:hypothetical protein [Devosia litorisediminis]MBS3850491.1 hypothetical protein [Devosia litorisediminis]
MESELITGLIILSIGGMFWLAYTHPHQFLALAAILMISSVLTLGGMAAYNMGYNAAVGEVRLLTANAADSAITMQLKTDNWWLYLVGMNLYLIVLLNLERFGLTATRGSSKDPK